VSTLPGHARRLLTVASLLHCSVFKDRRSSISFAWLRHPSCLHPQRTVPVRLRCSQAGFLAMLAAKQPFCFRYACRVTELYLTTSTLVSQPVISGSFRAPSGITFCYLTTSTLAGQPVSFGLLTGRSRDRNYILSCPFPVFKM